MTVRTSLFFYQTDDESELLGTKQRCFGFQVDGFDIRASWETVTGFGGSPATKQTILEPRTEIFVKVV